MEGSFERLPSCVRRTNTCCTIDLCSAYSLSLSFSLSFHLLKLTSFKRHSFCAGRQRPVTTQNTPSLRSTRSGCMLNLNIKGELSVLTCVQYMYLLNACMCVKEGILCIYCMRLKAPISCKPCFTRSCMFVCVPCST